MGPESTLPIDAATGLNAELTVFKQFWDAGQARHRRRCRIRRSGPQPLQLDGEVDGRQPDGYPTSGWLGRWLDGYLGGAKNLVRGGRDRPVRAIALVGVANVAPAVPAGRPAFGASANTNDRNIYAALRRLGAGTRNLARSVGGAMVDQLDLATTLAPLIRRTISSPTSTRRRDGGDGVSSSMPTSAACAQCRLGDFDSHAVQPNQHGTRMRELNAAVQRFFQVSVAGVVDRVTIMTFPSSVGRARERRWRRHRSWNERTALRAAAPTSAAADMAETSIAGGLGALGPDAVHVDFRDYYGSLIDGWLGGGRRMCSEADDPEPRLFRTVARRRAAGAVPPSGGPAVVVPGAGGTLAICRTIRGACATTDPRTRAGLGGRRSSIGPGETLGVQVTGVGGVPVSGVTAVAMNVTSVK